MMHQMIEEEKQIMTQMSNLKTVVDQIMGKLKQMFKNHLTTYSTIQTFRRITMWNNNMFQLALNIMTIYQGIFKIFIKLKINFETSFSSHWRLQFIIDSFNPQIMQKLPQLNDTINCLKLNFASNNTISIDQTNGISITQKGRFSHIQNTTNYAQQIVKNLRMPYSICDSILLEISKQIVQERSQNGMEIQNINTKNLLEDILKGPLTLNLIEKQRQRYSKYFQQEGTKKGLLKNPAFIPKNSVNQVTRSIYFYPNKNRAEILMTKEMSQNFSGSFSTIHRIIDYGEKISTFFYNRKGGEKEKFDPDHLLSRNEGKIELICKTVGGKQSNRDRAIAAFKNEVEYLKLKGGLHSHFICNYYFEVRKPNSAFKPGHQKKIYSDYHPTSVSDKFYNKDTAKYTMSDIINFGEQVMIGLIEFYLDGGFIHRDIKEFNILIDKVQGIIKIIDHGSVYLFDCKSKKWRFDQYKKIKEKFDSKLRTSIYVKQEEFQTHRFDILKNKYTTYKEYISKSATHRTFDVYSVGTMLKEMNEAYYSFQNPRWMEVCGRWDHLIDKMTKLEPDKRIQMEDALEEIKKLRAFLFNNC